MEATINRFTKSLNRGIRRKTLHIARTQPLDQSNVLSTTSGIKQFVRLIGLTSQPLCDFKASHLPIIDDEDLV